MSKTYRKDPYTQEDKRDGKVKKGELKRLRQEREAKRKQQDESRIQSD